MKVGYPKVQAPFVQSLAPERARRGREGEQEPARQGRAVRVRGVQTEAGRNRRARGRRAVSGRTIFSRVGVPVVLATANHFVVMQNAAAAKTIAELVREKLVRWSPEEVEQARKVLFGEAEVGEKRRGPGAHGAKHKRRTAGTTPPHSTHREPTCCHLGAAQMANWLFKEEPETYSFADLERDGSTTWSGVTNPHSLRSTSARSRRATACSSTRPARRRPSSA